MRVVILALVGFFLTACVARRPDPSEYPQINWFYDINWQNDCKMQRAGFHQSMLCWNYRAEIDGLERHFDTNRVKFTSVDDARSLFFNIIEGYLDSINSEKKLRPFMKHYPLTYKDFILVIRCSDSKEGYIKAPYICRISNSEGEFTCQQCDENGNKTVIFSEPMDTAYATYCARSEKN